MGLFNLFKPRLKIQDEVFGEMKYYKSKDPAHCFFEAEAYFKPLEKKIGFTIYAGETGPTKSQKNFYELFQQRYDQLKSSLIPLLNKQLVDWYAGRSIENFDQEFDLESIEIPGIDGQPVKWSICYAAKKINHWATIDFIDFEPQKVLIDG